MGALVKFTCPSCGDRIVPAEKVAIAMSEEFLWVTNCPRCGQAVFGRTDDGLTVSELIKYGAKINYAGVADEAEAWLGFSG